MKRSQRRLGALEPLGIVLQRDSSLRVPATVETSPISFRDWEAAVGTRIAARARPIRLERGVLLVRTATSTWAQELSLLADAIIAQLRGRSAKVDALRFRVGHVDAPERPPTRDEVRTSPPEVPLPPDVRREVERVADPELREAIARAAAKNLGWQTALAAGARPAPEASAEAPAPPRRPKAQGEATAPAAAPAIAPAAAPATARTTAATPAARAPRSAAPESAASGRGSRPSPGGRRGTI